MEYVHTGAWAKKAIKEAKLYGDVKIIASSEDQKFTYIPKNVVFSQNVAFAHITGNETIGGIEWQEWPKVPSEVPLVCDMSSNFMDKVIDVKKFVSSMPVHRKILVLQGHGGYRPRGSY